MLLGGSGSGKSALLRHLIGLEKPASGSIFVKGVDIVRCSEAKLNQVRRSIGVSFQNAALFGAMTVSENIAYPLLESTSLVDSTIDEVVLLKLAQVGLVHFGLLSLSFPTLWWGHAEARFTGARDCPGSGNPTFRREPPAGLDHRLRLPASMSLRALSEERIPADVTATVLKQAGRLRSFQSALKIADWLAFLRDRQIWLRSAPKISWSGVLIHGCGSSSTVRLRHEIGGSGGTLTTTRRNVEAD